MHTWMLGVVISVGVASVLPQNLPLAAVIPLLAIALALTRFRKFDRRLAVGCAGLCCGFAYATVHTSSLNNTLLPIALEQQAFYVEGYVTGLPREALQNGRPVRYFEFEVDDGEPVGLPIKRIELAWYEPIEIHSGQRWRLLVKLKRPRGFANPGGYDYQLALHQRRIDARGYVKTGKPLGARHTAGVWLQQARQRVQSGVHGLDVPRNNARFIAALGVGDKKALQPADWDLLRATGTTHLFVVSGLHISLVAGVAYTVVLYLTKLLYAPLLCWPAQRWAALAACGAAFGYALLAGFSLPTQRACIMVLVAMLGHMLNRPARIGGIFLTALFFVLLLDPLAPRSAGFWLSFSAVAALVLGFSGRLYRDGVIAVWLRTQWLVFLVLTPLLLAWFQHASLLMPIANLVAVPLVSLVIVPLVLLCSMFLLFGVAVPAAMFALVDVLFDVLWSCLNALTGIGSALQLASSPEPFGLFAALAGAVLILTPRGFPLRVIAPVFLLPLLFGRPAPLAGKPAELTVLDVGQGLAAVLRVGEKVLVYDAGPRYSETFDAGSAIIASFLRHKGIAHIDRLVVSHADNDHAGGLQGLLANIDVDTLQVGQSLPAVARDSLPCREGDEWQWGEFHFQVLHPDGAAYRSSNDYSCVLRISTASVSVLLSGDIEKAVENQLVADYGSALRSDILLVPHHGSKTSSTAAFVAAVAPGYAIVSSGYLNRFGHPHPDVVGRYRQQGAKILNTAHSGAISFDLSEIGNGEALTAREYRTDALKYWYHW